MNPQRFTEANTVMKAPAGMPNCCDVHAYKDSQHIITAWRPTPEELVKINLGEPIWLGIVGDSMPPVFVTADRPFVDPA